MQKRVYIAYTGGTIGMKKTGHGYAPAPGFLAEQLAGMPELRADSMPAYVINEYDPLLDSANLTPADWLKIAHDIAANDEQYDGFIVLHGTDTMAYTASALPFLLQGLRKPVILTGSQIPLCEVRSDARENIITALIVAAEFALPEVCLYFGDKLLRGCRSVKVNADGFAAFASPNFPPLGNVGIDIDINWDRVRPRPEATDRLTVGALAEPVVGTLRLFPGISIDLVKHSLQPPLQGLVLEAYGVGNGPDQNPEFLAVLKEATDRGLIIVACTQCLQGNVDLDDYATGTALARAGVISGYDLTLEAALAKLIYLFSQHLPVESIKRLMQTDMVGELSR
jgi:L-asparaginase